MRGEYDGTPSLMRTPLSPNNPGVLTLREDEVETGGEGVGQDHVHCYFT